MQTEHVHRLGDAAAMDDVESESVELVVTSPPYPMISLWDDLFSTRDPAVGEALDEGDADAAFERMHAQLDAVWDEVVRVLAPGGVVCVNVGDATRSIGGEFRQFPNHARVLSALRERGLRPLPDILWRKPTNRLTKFMGSGTLPPNAYVTLEHEYVLVFRKGGLRQFEAGDDRRYESAFFWEERNEWFSDLWTLTGTDQTLAAPSDRRERSAAFPLELPLRLVRMYSVYGDTVLDPFAGTGTTTVAAMLSVRNSVGYELDATVLDAFERRIDELPSESRQRVRERVTRHESFVEEAETETAYSAANYEFPVVTKQERRLKLYVVDGVARVGGCDGTKPNRRYVVEHRPFTDGN
ncbi:DNA-methyltransferase [Haloprofundus salilacus]|uniref:DNA-methyltransferase n=1 Tax=Haloprofundus salilacus TaxID=2876190 RepID=UPI001CD025A5|nr:site-specific DNA-methyltransferase [Haloprofundus salilacus]